MLGARCNLALDSHYGERNTDILRKFEKCAVRDRFRLSWHALCLLIDWIVMCRLIRIVAMVAGWDNMSAGARE